MFESHGKLCDSSVIRHLLFETRSFLFQITNCILEVVSHGPLQNLFIEIQCLRVPEVNILSSLLCHNTLGSFYTSTKHLKIHNVLYSNIYRNIPLNIYNPVSRYMSNDTISNQTKPLQENTKRICNRSLTHLVLNQSYFVVQRVTSMKTHFLLQIPNLYERVSKGLSKKCFFFSSRDPFIQTLYDVRDKRRSLSIVYNRIMSKTLQGVIKTT